MEQTNPQPSEVLNKSPAQPSKVLTKSPAQPSDVLTKHARQLLKASGVHPTSSFAQEYTVGGVRVQGGVRGREARRGPGGVRQGRHHQARVGRVLVAQRDEQVVAAVGHVVLHLRLARPHHPPLPARRVGVQDPRLAGDRGPCVAPHYRLATKSLSYDSTLIGGDRLRDASLPCANISNLEAVCTLCPLLAGMG